MPTPAKTPPSPLPAFVELKDASVNVIGLDPQLAMALGDLGTIHVRLFDKPLVITSGNDGDHSKGSKHYKGQAVDLRAWDKDPAGQAVFLGIISYIAQRANLAVFDERARDHSPHFHVELAD